MPAVLHITRGLPGSGKTRWARTMVDARPAGQLIRVNRDDLRAMALPSGYACPVPEVEALITLVQLAAIAALLCRSVDVVADDTNLDPRHVRELECVAVSVGARVAVHEQFLRVPVGECIRRDATRARPVGAAAIRGMSTRHGTGGVR